MIDIDITPRIDITTATVEELQVEEQRVTDDAMYLMDCMEIVRPASREESKLTGQLRELKTYHRSIVARLRELR